MQYFCPQEIMTNNGLKFCNDLMDVVSLQVNVKHISTNPYHPCWNGLTWCFNCIICALLEKNDNPNNKWQELLLDIFFANGTIPTPTTHHSSSSLAVSLLFRLCRSPWWQGSWACFLLHMFWNLFRMRKGDDQSGPPQHQVRVVCSKNQSWQVNQIQSSLHFRGHGGIPQREEVQVQGQI